MMVALHLAVLLFGAAALVAQATSLGPLALTLGRCLVAAPVLLALEWRGLRGQIPRGPVLRQLAVAGPLLALHWISFFQSMRLGGVPMALLSYASFPAFSLVLEAGLPAATSGPRRRLSGIHLGQLILLAGGLALLAGSPEAAAPGRTVGLAWGLLAGASFAALTRWNAARVREQGALRLAGLQLAGAALCLLPFAGAELAAAGTRDWFLLLVLGLLCTALGHGLFLHALHKVRPVQAALVAGLEPVYGVLLAALLGAGVLPREWAALPLVVAAALPLSAWFGKGHAGT